MADPIMVPVDPKWIPEGYEVLKVGSPREGEHYTSASVGVLRAQRDHLNTLHIILRKKRWRAEPDGEYWIIHSGGAAHDQYDNRDPSDDHLYNLGNYFRTREEAEAFLPKFKALFAERVSE